MLGGHESKKLGTSGCTLEKEDLEYARGHGARIECSVHNVVR